MHRKKYEQRKEGGMDNSCEAMISNAAGKEMCDMPTALHCYNSFYALWNEDHPRDHEEEAAREACSEICKYTDGQVNT